MCIDVTLPPLYMSLFYYNSTYTVKYFWHFLQSFLFFYKNKYYLDLIIFTLICYIEIATFSSVISNGLFHLSYRTTFSLVISNLVQTKWVYLPNKYLGRFNYTYFNVSYRTTFACIGREYIWLIFCVVYFCYIN